MLRLIPECLLFLLFSSDIAGFEVVVEGGRVVVMGEGGNHILVSIFAPVLGARTLLNTPFGIDPVACLLTKSREKKDRFSHCTTLLTILEFA